MLQKHGFYSVLDFGIVSQVYIFDIRSLHLSFSTLSYTYSITEKVLYCNCKKRGEEDEENVCVCMGEELKSQSGRLTEGYL